MAISDTHEEAYGMTIYCLTAPMRHTGDVGYLGEYDIHAGE